MGTDPQLLRFKQSWGAWHVHAALLLQAAMSARANPIPPFRGLAEVPATRELFRAPELMLRAFALECLMKALILYLDPTLIEKSPKKIFSHDLARLAEDAGFDLSADQRTMLDTLSAFGEWRGRYPFPTDDADFVERLWEPRFDVMLDEFVRRTSGLIPNRELPT